jgi:hypothetical protein
MRRNEKGQWDSWYHGYYEGKGTPQGASYLYWVDSKQDSAAFENFLSAMPGRVDLWLGAHTHTSPDDTYGGKSHIERRCGTTFVNVAGLTAYMGKPVNCIPRSWLLTLKDSGDDQTIKAFQVARAIDSGKSCSVASIRRQNIAHAAIIPITGIRAML